MNDKIARAEAWLNLCDDMGGEQYVGELSHRELFDAGWDAALEGESEPDDAAPGGAS